MLAAYLFSLIVGGGLLGFSLVAGGKDKDTSGEHGVDHDAGHEIGGPADVDALHDGVVGDDVGAHATSGDAALAVASGQRGIMRPGDRRMARYRAQPRKPAPMVKSLRFWTFLTAFGGLTGTSVTLLGLASAPITAALAAGLGIASAVGVGVAQRTIGKDNVTSLPTRADYTGAEGTVIVPVAQNDPGKVRLLVQGSYIDLRATTDENKPFARNSPAFVLDVGKDGTARIIHPPPSGGNVSEEA